MIELMSPKQILDDLSKCLYIHPIIRYSGFYLFFNYGNNNINYFLASLSISYKLRCNTEDVNGHFPNDLLQYEKEILSFYGYNCSVRDPFLYFQDISNFEKVLNFFAEFENNKEFYKLTRDEMFIFYIGKCCSFIVVGSPLREKFKQIEELNVKK